MLFCWPQLLCLVPLWLCSPTSSALCPSNCTCRLSEKGRRKVSCSRGGMRDPLPTRDMDPSVEVLEITAPHDNWNRLTVTPAFKHLKNLQELHISRSSVQHIGMHAFWGVPTLRLLDLALNNITALLDHNFRGLANLVELNLDDNNIYSLQSGVFKHLTELRILTLQRNFLGELMPRLFLKLGKLHVLKLSWNQFEELDPEVFKDIPELRVLECRGCGLRRINTQIYHLLPYLSHLDLGHNQMQFLASDEFRDLRRLLTLKLDGNQFPVVLEKTFVHQHELKSLNLARNRLAKITNTALLNLTNLQDLDIGYNKLDRLEVVAVQHVSETLQRLVISGNPFGFHVIKTILQTVHQVWDLGLAAMNLTQLPPHFIPDRVRVLDVSNNRLENLSVEGLPSRLSEIDLSGNLLAGLDEALVLRLEKLSFVNLSNNAWACNICDVPAILYRVNRTRIFRDLTCSGPQGLRGRRIASLFLEELGDTCGDEQGNAAASPYDDNKLSLAVGISILLVFLMICVIFVVCSCMRRRSRNALREQKRAAERRVANLDGPTALFCKDEISFKFPLDLTERKLSVSTIDEIKRDPTSTLPNGTGI